MNADDFLRRLRSDDRWTDDAPPLEAAGHSTRRPPARRSLVPVLTTAFTAVLVIVAGGAVLLNSHPAPPGSATHAPAPSSSSAVIPWIQSTPGPTPTSGVSIGVSVGRAPLCALSGLKVGSKQGVTAMGTWRAGVTLTNRGPAACELNAGDLALQALTDGHFVTFGKTTLQDPSGRFRLEPGRTAHLWGSLSPCYQDRHFSSEIPVPTYLSVIGERVRLAGTVPNDFRPLCAHPDAATGPSAFNQEGDEADTPSPFAGLRATLKLPKVVHAGETVNYTVTLSNRTATTIPLSPCPTYDQDFVASENGTKQQLVVTQNTLNCAPRPRLAPGQAATFAMRTTIPAHARGLAKISWSIDGNASATAMRTISPN